MPGLCQCRWAPHHQHQETKQCSCGKFGCWEQYCSDQYLIDEMNLHLETPWRTLMSLSTGKEAESHCPWHPGYIHQESGHWVVQHHIFCEL
ncbi:ROK family protein [Enterocloster sp.]|uniref:ROK family protein n=1 Tax=Enterocloster sp. TaxID=2719315 RepID=UPI00399F2139